MKAAELVAGRAYVARRSQYDLRYRVEVIQVARIEVEPATKWREAKKALRVQVEIKHNPYLDESRRLGFGGPRLDERTRFGNNTKHVIGEQVWMEARNIEQEWAEMEAAEQARKDHLALAELEAERVMGLCRDAGIADFVLDSRNWRSGNRLVEMSLSQAKVERLAVSILESFQAEAEAGVV